MALVSIFFRFSSYKTSNLGLKNQLRKKNRIMSQKDSSVVLGKFYSKAKIKKFNQIKIKDKTY